MAATGAVRMFSAVAATKNTWAVISAISWWSPLSTSTSTVYSTTRPLPLCPPLPLVGLPPPWLLWSSGLGGTGRICRTLPVQRRPSPLRVVK